MARTKKIATDEERRRATDQRLQRKFGISLADRETRAREQDNKCKICGGQLDAYGPPSIDHFHFYTEAFRVGDAKMIALGLKWFARVYDEFGRERFTKHAKTKAAAISAAKKEAMPWSIRSLLCFKCNRGLGGIEKFFDAARHPENLLPIIDYFRARLKNT